MKNITNTAEEKQYRLLDSFTGRWRTSGTMQPEEDSNAINIEGTDTYEWMPGGRFLIHRVDVRMGTELQESLEIIGIDPGFDRFFMHSYSSNGEYSNMFATERNGEWHFASDMLRFKAAFSADMTMMKGEWQTKKSGAWKHLMYILLEKQ